MVDPVRMSQQSVTLAYPSDKVCAVVAAPWSVGLDGDGRDLLAKVGVRVGRLPIYKHVQLTLRELPSVLPTKRPPISLARLVRRETGHVLNRSIPDRSERFDAFRRSERPCFDIVPAPGRPCT